MPLSCDNSFSEKLMSWTFGKALNLFLLLLMQFIIVVRGRLIQKQRTFFLSTESYIYIYIVAYRIPRCITCLLIFLRLYFVKFYCSMHLFIMEAFFKMVHVKVTKFKNLMG